MASGFAAARRSKAGAQSIQAQIINLLENLQSKFKLTYLFIAHDLSVVKHISNRIAVMYLDKVMEVAPASQLYRRPRYRSAATSGQPASIH